MTCHPVRRFVTLFSPIFLACLAANAQPQSGSAFPMIGIASGQSARVNVLNLARTDPANPTSCNVTLQFLDSGGRSIKQTTVNLQPGGAASLELSWDELPGTDLRVQLRALLLYGYSGGVNPPPQVLQQSACTGLTPSLEVYDNVSGRTSFILTDARALPPPAIPLA